MQAHAQCVQSLSQAWYDRGERKGGTDANKQEHEANEQGRY